MTLCTRLGEAGTERRGSILWGPRCHWPYSRARHSNSHAALPAVAAHWITRPLKYRLIICSIGALQWARPNKEEKESKKNLLNFPPSFKLCQHLHNKFEIFLIQVRSYLAGRALTSILRWLVSLSGISILNEMRLFSFIAKPCSPFKVGPHVHYYVRRPAALQQVSALHLTLNLTSCRTKRWRGRIRDSFWTAWTVRDGKNLNANITNEISYMDLIWLLLSFLLYATRARWRENRTIFNTPNPRLANASLLKEVTTKQQPGSRRDSLTKNGSRQPSLASIPRALDASGSSLTRR